MSIELISSVTLESSQSTITFDSIPQNYNDLYILISARCDKNDSSDSMAMDFNNAGITFKRSAVFGRGSISFPVQHQSSTSDNLVRLDIQGATTTLGAFSNASIYISNYNSSNPKSWEASNSYTNQSDFRFFITFGSGYWSGTTAISRLDFSPNLSSFVANTTISLYGIAGGGSLPTSTS